MKLYHWYSETLRDWGPGSIVIMAETVEEARERFFTGMEDCTEAELAKFKKDLAREPKVVEDGVFTMMGSA